MDTVIESGSKAPNFQLYDLAGKKHQLDAFTGKIVVMYFWSAECEWCLRVDQDLIKNMRTWGGEVAVLWIASNASETKDVILQVASERRIPIVLMDSDQQVADLYGAVTTPHFFVLDKRSMLVYQGAWDDVSFRQRVATQGYVIQIVDELKGGRPVSITRTPPYGCTLVRFMG